MMGLLDAITYAGDSLDKLGGRAVRGFLGGKPRELLSPIPFSDRIGITDPNDIVSGRNLTDQAGITSHGDSSLMSHLLGFGADMALDPTNYLGAGAIRALAKPGKFLGKAGASEAGGLGRFARGTPLASDLSVLPSRTAFSATRVPPTPGLVESLRHPLSPHQAMMVPPWGGHVEQALADAATAYGPQYPGGMSKLEDILGGLPGYASQAKDDLLGSPSSLFVAGELPTGSSVLGVGAEAAAFSAPHGGVVRVGKPTPWSNKGINTEMGRANIPEMLQPVRSILTPGGGYRVEHLPKVSPIYLGAPDRHTVSGIDSAVAGVKANPADARSSARANELLSQLHAAADNVSGSLARRIKSQHGLEPWDLTGNPTNVSLTAEGHALIHDPGSVWTFNPKTTPPSSASSFVLPPPTPGYPESDLLAHLRSLGGPAAVQEAISAGLARGTAGQGVPLSDILRGGPSANDLLGYRQELGDIASRYGAVAPTNTPTPKPKDVDANAWLNALNGSDFQAATTARGPATSASAPRKLTHGGIDIYRDVPLNTKKHGNVQGKYSPEKKQAVIYSGAADPRSTLRHELGHGRVDVAANAGPAAVAQLPFAWQPAAWAKLASGNNPASGMGRLGRYLDEVAQHSTQHRGFSNQARGGFDFATNPTLSRMYADNLEAGPLLRTLMSAPPFLNENRGAIALGALSAADLAKLTASIQRGQQR